MDDGERERERERESRGLDGTFLLSEAKRDD